MFWRIVNLVETIKDVHNYQNKSSNSREVFSIWTKFKFRQSDIYYYLHRFVWGAESISASFPLVRARGLNWIIPTTPSATASTAIPSPTCAITLSAGRAVSNRAKIEFSRSSSLLPLMSKWESIAGSLWTYGPTHVRISGTSSSCGLTREPRLSGQPPPRLTVVTFHSATRLLDRHVVSSEDDYVRQSSRRHRRHTCPLALIYEHRPMRMLTYFENCYRFVGHQCDHVVNIKDQRGTASCTASAYTVFFVFVLFPSRLLLTPDVRLRRVMTNFFGFTTVACFCYFGIPKFVILMEILKV